MEKINSTGNLGGTNGKSPRILVAPLDWGLGHATRCIPVIYELVTKGTNVWLAGEGKQEAILKQEFPGLPFLTLPGYQVRYGRSALELLKNIIFQTPRIIKMINQENEWLKKAVDDHGFDAVISDNRFGLYHHKIPSVFITHQLLIKTPFKKWADHILQKRNYSYINRFTECWIPDNEKNSLAGDLSHPELLPAIRAHYIGLLSRLKKNNIPEKRDHLFISLSGPEPQRTLLENKIIKEIAGYKGAATIVRGLPGNATIIPSTNDIKIYNHLPTGQYNKEMEQAEYVISRSGYSTVMDIATLNKRSVLIPTPGQTEQEYLASYLSEKQFAFSVLQKEFSLNEALNKAKEFTYKVNDMSESNLSGTIGSFLNQLKDHKPALG